MAEVDATLCKVFSDISSTDLDRIIPWCISTTASPDMIPIYHMSETLATAMQLGTDALVVGPVPGSKSSQAPAPMSSPACHSETPPLPSFPCQTSPISVHPQ